VEWQAKRMKAGTIVLVVLLMVGCATVPPRGKADLLAFLHDGTTSKEDVLVSLGEPSGVFDSGKILTYRLGKDEGGYVLLAPAPAASIDIPSPSSGQGVPATECSFVWRFVWFNISLVLVFDQEGIVRRHSLVDVMRVPAAR
jgi:hypothetical protein